MGSDFRSSLRHLQQYTAPSKHLDVAITVCKTQSAVQLSTTLKHCAFIDEILFGLLSNICCLSLCVCV